MWVPRGRWSRPLPTSDYHGGHDPDQEPRDRQPGHGRRRAPDGSPARTGGGAGDSKDAISVIGRGPPEPRWGSHGLQPFPVPDQPSNTVPASDAAEVMIPEPAATHSLPGGGTGAGSPDREPVQRRERERDGLVRSHRDRRRRRHGAPPELAVGADGRRHADRVVSGGEASDPKVGPGRKVGAGPKDHRPRHFRWYRGGMEVDRVRRRAGGGRGGERRHLRL